MLDKSIYGVNKCYGCGICSSVCPRHIIEMNLDKNGFYLPVINNIDDCINCGLCRSVCAYLSDDFTKEMVINAYSTYSLDTNIRRIASSGGTGFELAKYFKSNGYKVFSVHYNNALKRAEHVQISSDSDLLQSIGSKYLQSYTENVFRNIGASDSIAVFGTPCQIASLRHFFRKKKCKKVVLIDFFCHGVPSYFLWQKYLNLYKEPTECVTWRSKTSGWHDSWNMKIKTKSGKNFESKFSEGDLFYRFFLGNVCLNEACYKACKFKSTYSLADIRMGDMWGHKYSQNDLGITGILTFSSVGEDIISNLKIECKKEAISDVIEGQIKTALKKAYYVPLILFLLRTKYSLSFINRILTLFFYIDAFKMKIKKIFHCFLW